MRSRYRFAWRRAFRAALPWLPVVGLIGMVLFGFLLTARDSIAQTIGLSAVAGIASLIGGIQAAFAFAPADEPALEITLSKPRPLAYLLSERLLVIVALNMAMVCIGAIVLRGIVPGAPTMLDQFTRTAAPFTLMIGLGLVVGLIGRRANFGALLAILLVGAMVFGGAQALIALFEWAWIAHLFLPPEQFTAQQVMINRAFLLTAGAALIAYAYAFVRDEERLLAARTT